MKLTATSYHELSPRAVFATMAGVMIAMLMASLDQTIVGTAMPRIISELKGFQHYSGVITAYMIAATSVLPIAGKLSDIYGRKLFLLFGVAWFVVASALCGVASSMVQLVIYRALQGVGAGIMQTMAFTTIADLYPPAKRGKVMGWMASVFGFASVAGPLIGGYLTDGPGWRYVFYVNFPIGIAALLILFFFFPHVKPHKAKDFRIDYLGSITLVAALVPFLLALNWGGRDYPWNSPVIVGLATAGIFIGVIFFMVEVRAPHPVLSLQLFKNRIIAVALGSSSLIAVTMFGVTIFIPLFVQSVLGESATASGKVLMPMTLSLLLTAIFAGQLITRTGQYRYFAIFGSAMSALGVFLLSRMDMNVSYLTVVRNIVIAGIGLGATMPVFNLAVQNAVDINFVGAATSMVQFTRSIGGALGVAIFGSVLINSFTPAFHERLSPHIMAELTPEQRAVFDNPQTYMRGSDININMMFTNKLQGKIIEDNFRRAARAALAEALNRVFLIGAFLLFVATLLTFLLKEIPLRKTNNPREMAPETL